MDYPANEAGKTLKKLPISLAGQTLTGASFAKTALVGVIFIGRDASPTCPDCPANCFCPQNSPPTTTRN
jgi:hypothetical protein